jgi:hypothetical protein
VNSQPLKKRFRVQIQVTALLLGALAPFGLFSALQNNQPAAGILAFTLIVLSMVLTAWVG